MKWIAISNFLFFCDQKFLKRIDLACWNVRHGFSKRSDFFSRSKSFYSLHVRLCHSREMINFHLIIEFHASCFLLHLIWFFVTLSKYNSYIHYYMYVFYAYVLGTIFIIFAFSFDWFYKDMRIIAYAIYVTCFSNAQSLTLCKLSISQRAEFLHFVVLAFLFFFIV